MPSIEPRPSQSGVISGLSSVDLAAAITTLKGSASTSADTLGKLEALVAAAQQLASNNANTLSNIMGGANSAVDTFIEAYNRFIVDEGVAAGLTTQLAAKANTTDVTALLSNKANTADLVALAQSVSSVSFNMSNGYQVQPNKTIQGPDGRRFIVKGVTFLDGLFISFENRTDYTKRVVSGQTVTTDGSSQTGYEASVWVDKPTVISAIKNWRRDGVNLLRVGVEPAIFYTAAANGFPSHIEMLDTVIDEAAKVGLVVQIQNGNDNVPTALNVTFLGRLRDRYWSKKNVWINPMNEINCSGGGSICTDVSVWSAEIKQYVQALRADVTGMPGVKFTNPVVINATNYGYSVSAVASFLQSDAFMSAEKNLIIGVHMYPQGTAFNGQFPDILSNWVNYIGVFCIFVDEFGRSNVGTIRDAGIDPGASTASYPITDATTLQNYNNYVTEATQFFRRATQDSSFSGATIFCGTWYVPGLGVHDPNSLKRRDGTWTQFGALIRDTWLNDYLPGAWNIWNVNVSVESPGTTPPSFTVNEARYRTDGHTLFARLTLTCNQVNSGGGRISVTLPIAIKGIQAASGYCTSSQKGLAGVGANLNFYFNHSDASPLLIAGAQYVMDIVAELL